MKKIYFIISFLCAVLSYAQDSIRISGQLLNNTRYAKIVVKKFGVGSFDIIALPIQKDGTFKIAAPKELEPGIYRFQYSQSDLSGYLDIIMDGKENEIEVVLDLDGEALQPIFKTSIENKNWYAYKNEVKLIMKKIQLISQFINEYPNKEDAIYAQATQAYENEIKSYYANRNLFLANNKATWAAEMVANTPIIFTNPKDDVRIQDFNKKEAYWNGINTSNPKLINTPLYTEHILNYLQYYMNPAMEFSEKEKEEGFIKSLDIIIQKFSGSDATKKFAIQYLQLGFKEMGNEKVLQYIDEKYKETLEQCQEEADKADFDKRVQGYAAIKVGNKAPDISFTTLDFNLHALAAERTIVVFWASWCPHCMLELPKLNDWAVANPKTKVIAISLDEDKTAYEIAIAQFPALIHDTDLKKWEGKAVTDYYVYGTPTFIVLDKDKKILGKFPSIEQLEAFINQN